MTIHGPEPLELATAPLDYDHYLEKQLAPAAEGLLSCLGTDFGRLVGRQMQLF